MEPVAELSSAPVVEKSKAMDPVEMISKLFPKDRSEFKRDIKHLWENRYRVNFWRNDPNTISRSYFVIVEIDEVYAYINEQKYLIDTEVLPASQTKKPLEVLI